MPYKSQIEKVDQYLNFFVSVHGVHVSGVCLIPLVICRLSVELFLESHKV
jgi:hypothetical protein